MSNTEDRNDETINLDLDEHTSAEDADMDVNTEANANADDDFEDLEQSEIIVRDQVDLLRTFFNKFIIYFYLEVLWILLG